MFTLMVPSHMTTVQKLLHSVFSPPRPIHELKDPSPEDEEHNKNSAETGISSAANRQDELPGVKEDRCRFTFSDGRQCRNQRASLCVHHSSRKSQDFGAEDAPDAVLEALGLEGLCGDLTTATNINRALSQVFLLMAQGRISQKQAVAFGYISQLLLQTVPGIRSEHVSVHGYRDWEANLKSKITSQIPTPAAQNEPPASAPPPAQPSPDYGDLLRRSRDMMAGKSPIRSGPASRPPAKGYQQDALSPVNEVNESEGTLLEPQTTPDYADIFLRSRDMMAGKYDTTPEGRREANALALELELMNPAPAKPRKDFFGRTVALVRRLREHQSRKSGVASQPPSAPAPFPTAPAPVPSFAISAPATPSVAAFEAAAKAAIPAASPPSPSDSNAPSDQSPVPRPKQEMPVPGITLTRTGHTTAWYAPASWSGPRPDPFPSRKERLRRSLRTMSNSRQHQMQNRAFWHSPCNSRTMNTCTERLGGYQSKQLMI